MKRIKVGDIYSAKFFINGVRYNKEGFYHFEIITKKHDLNGNWFFLGLKTSVLYTADHPQCFWFNNDGVYDDGEGVFNLQRKLKKEVDDYARFE